VSVTHIAGLVLHVGGRTIQRCSLCGEKLIDNKGEEAPLNPDGSTPKTLTWEVGRLVRFEGDNPVHSHLLDDTDKLPEDSCLDLVED
jgi:hypothetical protein